ncbi:MAG: NAD(P)/FAD-dependent oxidoreductase [Turicibacter sp.]|nr:NAD(P)/FAD-dependent oxidoreductase [Turicibacter sp.]
MEFDLAIVGCGVVGAACAYELSKYNLKIVVLERENDVAASGATKSNSAVIHAGFDPPTDTLMAKLNVAGSQIAQNLLVELDVAHKKCGALVLAFTEEDEITLRNLYDRGTKNGTQGLKILDRLQTLSLEPNLNPALRAALHAPTSMIVSPWEYTLALAEVAVQNGATILLEHEVLDIKQKGGVFEINTPKTKITANYILNAGGLFADKIHNMVASPSYEITPDKGEYFLLDRNKGETLKHTIFQCPNQHGKGVLVSPTVHGNIIVGPSSNDPPKGLFDVSHTAAALERVAKTAKLSVPDLDFYSNIRNFAGNRAKTNRGDFIIEAAADVPKFVDCGGIVSPGLSAAPAIAIMAAELLQEAGLRLEHRAKFNGSRKAILFKELSDAEKNAAISQDKSYAHIICRCETITEGDILWALRSPVPPRSLDAVKRRVSAGFGRCQGGFCSPRVLEILTDYYGCSPTDILQDLAGTELLFHETKTGQEGDNMDRCSIIQKEE